MATCGKADLPWQTNDPDALGLDKFANALTSFALDCETPMTIAIQGEWGSGKTSLMNMVYDKLQRPDDVRGRKKQDVERVIQHRFETWQYGAVGEDGLLGVHLMTNLTQALAEINTDDGVLAQSCAKVCRLAQRASGVAGLVAKAATAGAVSTTGLDGATFMDGLTGNLGGDSKFVDLSALKQEFQKVIERLVGPKGKKPGGRVVVFIDDLDRIRPGRAVALLEILKNFLDVQHCVFVVACDYQVVREGVKERLGIDDEEKVSAFFHKIFQLPFVMPTKEYSVQNLLKDYLESRVTPGKGKGKAQTATDLAAKGAPLIELATGTNPRGFKRFLNTLDLLSCISAASDSNKLWSDETSSVSLIALAAMQAAWPEVTRYVSDCDDVDHLNLALSTLRDGVADEDQQEDKELCGLLSGLFDIKSDGMSWRTHPKVETLCQFGARMFALLDTDYSGDLDANEVAQLVSWAKALSLTGVSTQVAKGSGRTAFRHGLDKGEHERAKEFMGVVAHMTQRCKALDSMNVSWTANSVAFTAQTPEGSRRMLTGAPDCTFKLNIGRQSSDLLDSAGRTLMKRCDELGFPWTGKGQKSSTLDFKQQEFELGRLDQLNDVFGDLLTEADRDIENAGRSESTQALGTDPTGAPSETSDAADADQVANEYVNGDDPIRSGNS